MAVPASFDKSARIKFSYPNPKDTLERSREMLSLRESTRFSSPVLRSMLSPVSRVLNAKSPETNLIDEIASQLRRLNPDIQISGNLNQNLSQNFKKAVDSLIQAQSKYHESDPEKLRETIESLNTQLREANQKLQSNSEFEKKLTKREEHLALQELKLMTDKKHFQNDKNQIALLKKNFLQLEAELKAAKGESQEKENRIQELLNESFLKSAELEELRRQEIPEIRRIKELQIEIEKQAEILSNNQKAVDEKEIDLVSREEKMSKEKAELEAQKKDLISQLESFNELKSKVQQESEFFEKSNKELESFRLNIEIEHKKLKEIKQALELEKDEISATQRALTSQKSLFLEELENLEQQKLNFMKVMNGVESIPKVDAGKDDVKFERKTLEFFPHLRSLISDAVSELSMRTLFIQKWTNSLRERELCFESRLDDVKIVLSLINEKLESLGNDYGLLQPLLSVVSDLLSELNTKKMMLEEEANTVSKEAMESCGDDYLGSSTQILYDLLNDFEIKANELQVIDEHLQSLQESLAEQSEENSRIAKFLMEDRLEFEKEKNRNQDEIETATVKLLELQEKTERTLLEMSKKEKEVLALQQSIDSRT